MQNLGPELLVVCFAGGAVSVYRKLMMSIKNGRTQLSFAGTFAGKEAFEVKIFGSKICVQT